MNKVKFRSDPEHQIQTALVKLLRLKGWFIIETHGSIFQKGLPDIYATHSQYGVRWIEVKNGMGQWKFTAAQKDTFPKLIQNGTSIWLLMGASEDEYQKLFHTPNMALYLLEAGL